MRENNSVLYNLAQQVKYYVKFIKKKNVLFNEDVLKVFKIMYMNHVKIKTGVESCNSVHVYDIITPEVVRFAKKPGKASIIHMIIVPTLVRLLYYLNEVKLREIENDEVVYNLFDEEIIELDQSSVEETQVNSTVISDLEKRLIMLYCAAEHAASHFAELYKSNHPNWDHSKFKTLGNLLTTSPSDEIEDRLYPENEPISNYLN